MTRKKKLWIIWIVPVVFIVISYYYSTRSVSANLNIPEFSINDTAAIDLIVLDNKQNEKTILKRLPQGWMVNDKYNVRTDAIETLLKTAFKLKVYAPVSKNAIDNVKEELVEKGIRVAFYAKGTCVKAYYVGGPTQNRLNTYMILTDKEKGSLADMPYLIHIPGFQGYVTPYYFLEENAWRSQTIVGYKINELVSVSVKDFNRPEWSFTACWDGKKFSLKDAANQQVVQFDTNSVYRYLSYFEHISFETPVAHQTKALFDSITRKQPLFQITIKAKDKTTAIKTFSRYLKSTDSTGTETYHLDPDRLFAQVNNEKELLLVQYFLFDKLSRSISFFKKEQPQ